MCGLTAREVRFNSAAAAEMLMCRPTDSKIGKAFMAGSIFCALIVEFFAIVLKKRRFTKTSLPLKEVKRANRTLWEEKT